MTNDEMRARCEREIAAIERKLRGIDPMEPDDKLDGMLRGYLDWHLELKELNRDRSIAHDYIRDNFRGEDTIAVVLLNKQTGNIQQRVAKAAKIASHPYQRWLKRMNAGRYEIYVSMNTMRPDARGRRKQDVQEIRHIYLDFDEDARAKLEALQARTDLPRPNWVIESSPGKYQVTWKVEGFTAEQAEGLMGRLVRETGADPAVHDCARVMRLPGFRNHKYGAPGHLVTAIKQADGIYRLDSFPAPQQPEHQWAVPARNGRTQRTPAARAGGSITQSERDWAYAMRHLKRGESPDVVVQAIAQHRSRDTKHADPYKYAERTVANALRTLAHGQPGPTQREAASSPSR